MPLDRIWFVKGSKNWTAPNAIAGALELQLYALHRAAVTVFAEKRNLDLPSWWKNSDSGKAQVRNNFEDHSSAIDEALSPGPKPKEEVRAHVRKHLMGYSKKLFEDAWKETPGSRKLKQGQSLSNLLGKPS